MTAPSHISLGFRLLVCVFLGATALPPATAQIASKDKSSTTPAAQRIEELRHEAEHLRTQAENEYQADEAACYKRFLVNHCIDEAKAKRLAVVRQARTLEAEAHQLDLTERNRVADEVVKKAAEHGAGARSTAATTPSADVASPKRRPESPTQYRIKPNKAQDVTRERERARERAEATRRAEAARRDRERYDARIRELEEKKARDESGRCSPPDREFFQYPRALWLMPVQQRA